MAQTTTGMTFTGAQVEISTDNSSWDDISGEVASVVLAGGDRNTGLVFTFDGDTAIIGGGKRTPVNIGVNTVYTEGATDPFEVVRGQYETAGGGDLYVRWSPAGGTTGDFQYTSSKGIVTNAPYPVGVAETGDIVMFTFTTQAASVTKAAVT